jgi:DNA-binding MarR family transcriptional regulator
MESCQVQEFVKENMVSLDAAMMDWTAILVRLWMHDINFFTRSAGLSFGQMNLLLHIHYRGPCEITTVSDLMQMTHPGASQMVERMVQQGLVIRSEIPGDRRVRLVQLTDQGCQMVEECIRTHERWIHNLVVSLTPELQTEAVGVLQMLTSQAYQLKLR